jgi:hypothetical protein
MSRFINSWLAREQDKPTQFSQSAQNQTVSQQIAEARKATAHIVIDEDEVF